ncbi:AAA family ATPase [Dyadobacter fanqingshengii]|uniref:ATP-binding protein n=1 Tax=Dyadobacter fanqingshengii TaxID=2906443 RepID=A0A9X1P9D0_9BACT|nr:AAA family ATPase [Dyadobacter fanqingshengii]MCF0039703.1 ATP-binding protein [Dyadobacter fanqingshengii]USJ38534.1 ATP-binding protein [Dyadobacter fanqingshengii]
MKFIVLPDQRLMTNSVKKQLFLIHSEWDDYFQFATTYLLFYVTELGAIQSLGVLKIGEFKMGESQRSPMIPLQFDSLDDRFFSLGQDEDYYGVLATFGPSFRDEVLDALNDVARDLDLFERALHEKVMGVSLLRDVSKATVRGQLHRVSRGGARLSPYNFSYFGPPQLDRLSSQIVLSFAVLPNAEPPTNIHVLIGRNGVGKTFMLNSMTNALVAQNSGAVTYPSGSFSFNQNMLGSELFANIVSVTFSAFDPFPPLPEAINRSSDLKYSYIGLKSIANAPNRQTGASKGPEELANEFATSAKLCLSQPARALRWRRSLLALQSDTIFRGANIAELSTSNSPEHWIEASQIFARLSSGHKIVLLTMTRLVETVEERTLVLLDEPEAHLHPPLLSAFIRSISDLMIDRNGVALIATHSPVVLQEVPRSCVWKVRRNGQTTTVERPEIETFGENIGILTREIFGLEVTDSGFHNILRRSVDEELTYEDAVNRFDGQLGEEAKAIVRTLMIQKNRGIS